MIQRLHEHRTIASHRETGQGGASHHLLRRDSVDAFGPYPQDVGASAGNDHGAESRPPQKLQHLQHRLARQFA